MRHLKAILAAGLLAGPIWMGPALAEGVGRAPVTRAEAEHYAPANPWTGFYGEIEGGMAAAHSNTSPSNNLFSTDASVFGGFYGFGAGADLQVAKKFVFGVFGDFDELLSNGATFTAATTKGTGSLEYKLDRQWSLGGRGGYLLTPSTLGYGLVAFSQLDNVKASTMLAGKPMGSASADFNGWQFGGGLEQRVWEGWSIKGEYRYGMYETQTLHLAPSNMTSTIEPREHQFKAALVYKFPVGFLSDLGSPLK